MPSRPGDVFQHPLSRECMISPGANVVAHPITALGVRREEHDRERNTPVGDVAIVGGGILGMTLALRLQARECESA